MSSVKGQLLVMLETVAKALGDDLRGRLVFVGGCTTALFITDEITLEGVRATDDVDLIVDLVGRAQWAQLQEQLRQKGFAESPEDDVICRMRLGDLKVDIVDYTSESDTDGLPVFLQTLNPSGSADENYELFVHSPTDYKFGPASN